MDKALPILIMAESFLAALKETWWQSYILGV